MGKPKRNTGNWLMTYGDLMTLLLVFFVLMYVLTPSISDGVFKDFIEYFQKNPGLLDAQNTRTSDFDTPPDSTDIEEIMEQRMQYWEEFSDFLEQSQYSSEVDVEISTSGVKITLSDSLTFRSGSDQLLPDAKLILEQISSMIDNQITVIEVQGHTDNVPIRDSSIHRSNWHLGAARAVSVVRNLQDNSTVDPSRFKASSFGEYNPIADNSSAAGRKKNRRVEIYLRDQLLNERQLLKQDVWH